MKFIVIDVTLRCVTVHSVHFTDEQRLHIMSSALYCEFVIVNFQCGVVKKANV
jgi:hypothetical protein